MPSIKERSGVGGFEENFKENYSESIKTFKQIKKYIIKSHKSR